MSVSRRVFLMRAALAGFVSALPARPRGAAAETVAYTYDALGRLTRAEYAGGCAIDYVYDPAGNRTQLTQVLCVASPPPPPPPPPGDFTTTIPITGTGPINLRTLADAAGYNGAQNATVTFTLASGVTIFGAAGAPGGGIGVDTGTWPTTAHIIALTLQVTGSIYGGGGRGGAGGVGSGAAGAGGAGGDAIYCRLPLTVTVNAGGQIKAGGGGGGGGQGVRRQWNASGEAHNATYPAGSGGGGYPNGGGGPGQSGYDGGAEAATGPAGPGGPGTLSGGGAGGPGLTNFASTRVTGAGGAGGGAGAAGGGGGASGGSGGTGTFTTGAAGAGGVAGYAIRKNGHAVTVTNNGAIVGSVG